jgi:hypothetical protein
MNSSKSGQLPFSDVDDDMELEELFGFRAKADTSSNRIASATVETSNNLSISKGRASFDSWKEKMEADIRKNNDDDDVFNRIKITEPAVKLIRLDEITEADVDELEDQLFQKYTENEGVRDDLDDELEVMKSSSSSGNHHQDAEGGGEEGEEEDEAEAQKDYYEISEADEEEEGMLLNICTTI